MNARKQGFTLIEMLVVIGIIAVLSSALIFSYGRVVKAAARAKAVELVSNARTALEEMYLNNDGWPSDLYKDKGQGEDDFYVMGENVARLLAQNHLLNVDCSGGKLRGKDRCGIVDPWAQDVLMRDKSNGLETSVPTGGKVKYHRLYFAVDQDDDGFVSKAEGAPSEKRVRSKVIVWCAGADGGLSDCTTDEKKTGKLEGRSVTNQDNVYSWKRAQEEK